MIIPYQKASLDYPLVNVYITYWKDSPCFIAGKINELSMAIFNSELLVNTRPGSFYPVDQLLRAILGDDLASTSSQKKTPNACRFIGK